MDEVADSLEEAAGYERLALERRKGLFGLMSATLLVMVFAWFVLGGNLRLTSPVGLGVFAVVFALSFGLRALLRKRPGWEPLFERPRGRRFWIRYALSITILLAAVFFLGVFVFESGSASLRAGFMPAVFAALGALFIWLFPRHIPIRYSIFVAGCVAAILLFSGIVPPAYDLETTIGALALASIAEATYRLAAPRRWLVR